MNYDKSVAQLRQTSLQHYNNSLAVDTKLKESKIFTEGSNNCLMLSDIFFSNAKLR